MDCRNRLGLYGSYLLGMAGIGFTLPYLPLYLGQQGMSDRTIGLVSTLAALAGLAQFPIGLWSDRLRWRKPFLVVALALLALATVLLTKAPSVVWLGLLVILFAENGACRATVESLAGAEATHLAPAGQVGAALGALRFWKPVSIVTVALAGSILAEEYGVASVLMPLAVVQVLAVGAALLIHEEKAAPEPGWGESPSVKNRPVAPWRMAWKDPSLWAFVLAMVLFHSANAPGGVYLGLFLKRDLQAPDRLLSYAFIVSMLVWMLVIRPVGRLADRLGRRPLLIMGWTMMSLRLVLVAVAQASWQILAIQVLDGLAQAFFAVLAAAWVTDRLADPRRLGEAQVLVGSALVLGSAVGPAFSCQVVDALGYRGMFGVLAGIGVVTTTLVVVLVPETLQRAPTGQREPLRTKEATLAAVPPS